MFAKRLLQKAVHHSQHNVRHGSLRPDDVDPRIQIHYGIPSTATILAFDPIQGLLAVGTLDGRIKVIGGDGIEGLLISPKQLSYKNLEFLQNQGFLVSISTENDIQVWNLESRCLACSSQWQSNITAFSVISGSHFMYIGDEYGLMSVMKYDAANEKLLLLPYNISADSLIEAAGFSLPDQQPIVGILPQPCSSGNRVLIAYENGLIILWDVSEAQILFMGGGKDLQLKDGANSPSEADINFSDDTSEYQLEDKEISSLCWASSSGSILAVGYIDGDILFWNTSYAASSKSKKAGSSKNVVKLQLSSAERKLPVIVLHWSASKSSHTDCKGQLFIYGGDEIGSEEVLTVLSLEWSSGMEILRCVGRVDLTLSGSFADMILLPSIGATRGNQQAALFVLTNPGQLHLYDDASLSALLSQQERKPSFYGVEFPVAIPTADPSITMAKFSTLSAGGNSSKGLLEIASVTKLGSTATLAGGTKWLLTGGVPSNLSASKDNRVDGVYVAGYQDGSVRIWDTTYSVLSLICVLKSEVEGIKVPGLCAPVSALNFSFITLSLAVGNECGLVCIYDLNVHSEETTFHYVTETNHEVHNLPQRKGPQCRSVFGLNDSSIQALEFSDSGTKLAVGFVSGLVAVLDLSSSSILFFSDFGTSSSVISMTWTNIDSLVEGTKYLETEVPDDNAVEPILILTKNASISIVDTCTGNMISSHPLHLKKETLAVSMYAIEGSISVSKLTNEKHTDQLSKDTSIETDPHEKELPSSETECDGASSLDALVLLCCENQLRLYSLKSVIKGHNKTIRKVKHEKPCCWTTTFKKDGEVCGLVLLFQTGTIEIRSLPDLELVKETSLMSILRWNFKVNMDKTMSSSDNGQITLANGSEVAFISLLVGEKDFRTPQSLPCLHDKVLAAAADAALSFSTNQKKKQIGAPAILGGIVRGFKGGREDIDTSESKFSHLEDIFLKFPFSKMSPTVTDNQDVVELDIDDIEIDETPPVWTSSHEVGQRKREKETDREKLLGPSDDAKPRLRTPQEIIAKYRKAEDASSAAAQARNRLVQRQEKLERISRRTEELQSGAEDFASLANELVKTMENRKWWHI